MPLFGQKTPEKYEQRALAAEQRGKTRKALKNREKAANLRAKMGLNSGAPIGTTGVPLSTGLPMGNTLPVGTTSTTTTTTTRNFGFYENKALRWEQRNNMMKAQKNREKAWRYNNPQYSNVVAPQFYESNRFLGYNVPVNQNNLIQTSLMKTNVVGGMNTMGGIATHTTTAPVVVETHVRPTIVEQTVRQEKITEVQPIIHREVDAPHVKVIEKHMYETVASQGPHTITNQAIVQEVVKPRIIEEIQPVVHRNVAQTVVERVEQHSTQHIVAPTTTTKEVIQDRSIHTVGVAAGGPIGVANAGGMGQQVTQTTTTSGPMGTQTQTATSGPLGTGAHAGLANNRDTLLSGQHNAAHINSTGRV